MAVFKVITIKKKKKKKRDWSSRPRLLAEEDTIDRFCNSGVEIQSAEFPGIVTPSSGPPTFFAGPHSKCLALLVPEVALETFIIS